MKNDFTNSINVNIAWKQYLIIIFCFLYFNVSELYAQAQKSKKTVFIVNNDTPTLPVIFAFEKLKIALEAKGYVVLEKKSIKLSSSENEIIVGIRDNQFLSAFNCKLHETAEALLIKKPSNKQMLAVGWDASGAMYAMLELAEQIDALPQEADVFKAVEEINEKPFCTERSLSTYINSKHIQDGFFHDSNYWETLFEQLARSRVNSYNLIFKYKAPIYTLFFELQAWPSSTTGGIVVTATEQQRNLKALQNIVKSAHNHGVKITLGIWDHVSNPDDADRLADYSEAAIKKIVNEVDLDAFQFRMHWESGLPRDLGTLSKFWGSVFDGIKKSGRKIKFYPRAKGLADTIINLGLSKGLEFAIETKFTAEQIGMPFHPAHIQKPNQTDRRHGYADLLSYPKQYDMLYRVWNGGTQKLLLWGDLDWAKRFALSTKLYNKTGIFEFMEIEGAEPMGNGSKQALTENYQYTRYEFQRFWCQNLMIGRMGYNPQTQDEIFLRAFEKHYGKKVSKDMMQGLAHSSKIIPRIISSAMADFQEQRGVPEWGSGSGLNGKGTLAAYAKVLPLDIQTFASFQEEAEALLKNKTTAKYSPLRNANWYKNIADSILFSIKTIEINLGDNLNKETKATLTDMKILAGIARFHSQRIKAAVAYQMYLQTDKSALALDTAIHFESLALQQYQSIVKVAGDTYRKDLNMTVSDANHWTTEYELLQKAFEELKKSTVNNQTTIPSIHSKINSQTVNATVIH
ncbi:MAG: hypothetical protein KA313_06360, partial [Pseudarcicella sp.]|nr:hypothetical protein [Pseudarcicella sp.]